MTTPGLVRTAALAALTLLAFVPARADVVPPPNQTCPPGGQAGTSHCGLYCRPWACTSDAQCTGGKVCREQPLCVHPIPCSNRLPDAGVFYLDDARLPCPVGNECAVGDTCKAGKRCVTPDSPVPSASGCSVQRHPSRTGGTVAFVMGVLALGILLTLRLRRRAA